MTDEPMDPELPAIPAKRWATVAVVCFASLLFLPRMLSGALRQFDESAYAQSSREMLAKGDLLTVWWNGSPNFEKPPLGMWGAAAAFWLFGESEFTARLFAGVCGLGVVGLLVSLTTKLSRWETGMCAGLTLLCIPDFCRYATMGQLDMPLTLAVTTTIVGFWRGLEQPRWHWLAGVAFGLGLMTKGTAVGLAVVVIGAYVLVARDFRFVWQPACWGALVLGVLIALPWHLYQVEMHGNDFADEYAQSTVLRRIGWTWVRPDFYFEHLFKKGQPWGTLVVVVMGIGSVAAWKSSDRRVRLAWCWAVVIPLLLSLLHSKWSRYLVPMYPGVGLLAALLFARTKTFQINARWSVVTLALLATISNAEVLWRPANTDNEEHLRALGPIVRREVPPHAPLHVAQIGRRDAISPPAAIYYSQRWVHSLNDFVHLAEVVERTDHMVHLLVHQSHLRRIETMALPCRDGQRAVLQPLAASGPIVLLRIASPALLSRASMTSPSHARRSPVPSQVNGS